MLMRVPEYCKDFVSCRMSKTYAHKAWKGFNDVGEDLTDFPTLNEKDTLISEKEDISAVEPIATETPAAAVPAVKVGLLLAVSENDDWEPECSFALDAVEPVGVN